MSFRTRRAHKQMPLTVSWLITSAGSRKYGLGLNVQVPVHALLHSLGCRTCLQEVQIRSAPSDCIRSQTRASSCRHLRLLSAEQGKTTQAQTTVSLGLHSSARDVAVRDSCGTTTCSSSDAVSEFVSSCYWYLHLCEATLC